MSRWPITIATAYRAYELALDLNGAVDFDGVIGKAYELRCTQPELCAQYRESYRYILIDEAQDTSTAQYESLKVLCGVDRRNGLMVADPAQSIYAFAGASSRFVEAFEREFGAQRYELGTTFRCAGEILRVAGSLLPASAKGGANARAQAASARGLVSYSEWDSEADEASAEID